MDAFLDCVAGLRNGDFTRVEPTLSSPEFRTWLVEGRFDETPELLGEALSCACFNGNIEVATLLLDRGVNPTSGDLTGLNAFHYAANRGQLETVRLLMDRGADPETLSPFGANVLGTTVWSALNEPKPDHIAIVKLLLERGARRENALLEDLGFPTGNAELDATLSSPPV